MKLALKIVTPERIVFEDVVDSVSAMTEQGEVTILPQHDALVATLKAGEARVKKNGEEYALAHSTGFLEVRGGDAVTLLADTAERAEDLDLAAIEAARDRAAALLAEKGRVDEEAFAHAAAALERELARYRVASKSKYRKIPQRPGETEV